MPRGLVYRNNNSYPLTATEVDDNFEYLATRETDIDVHAFGAVGDGVTDDSSALQAAIDAAETVGGGCVKFGARIYATSTELLINENNVFLVGLGSGASRGTSGDGSSTNIRKSAATRIVRLSSANGGDTSAVLRFATEGGTHRRSGGGIRGIMIDGGARATIGIHVVGRLKLIWDDWSVVYCTASNVLLDVPTTEILAQGPYDTQYCSFKNFYITNINSPACAAAHGIKTLAFENVNAFNGTADGILADAMGNPNCSFNLFENGFVQASEQHAIWPEGATDNTFYMVSADVVTPGSGVSKKYPWVFCSSTEDSRLGAAATKRNLLIKCYGDILEKAGQSGGISPKFNRILNHRTHTLAQFAPPVTTEAAAGGSPEPFHTIDNDAGYINGFNSYADYTHLDTDYQRTVYRTAKTVISMTGGGATVDAQVAPAGATVLGLTGRVTTVIVGAGGPGFKVGTAADDDRFAAVVGYTNGNTWSDSDWTAGTIEKFLSGLTLRFTAASGVFTSGEVTVQCAYILSESVNS